MNIRLLLISALMALNILLKAQQLPEGYILQYRQTFNNQKSVADFRLTPSGVWNTVNNKGNLALQCKPAANGRALPAYAAVLSNKVFGDFILEAGIKFEPDSSGNRDFCLILGMKDTTRYYCVILSGGIDSSLHGAYLVKDSQISRLDGLVVKPLDLPANKWHNIRLERNILQRTIVVFVNDMKQPVMRIKDYELVMGMVGLGSFSGGVQCDNLSIWAPTMIVE